MFYISDKVDWKTYKASLKKEKKSDVKESVKDRVEVDENELEDLRRKNEKLIEAYKNVVEKYNRLVDAYKTEQEKSWWELCNHLIFFYRKFQEYKKFVEWKVFWTAEYNKREKGTQDTMESVRPDVYARYNFEYWEIEEEECKAVEKIIAKRDEENASLPF